MDAVDYSILTGTKAENAVYCPYCGKVLAKVMRKSGSIVSFKCRRCSKEVTLKI